MNEEDDPLSYFDDPLKDFTGSKEIICLRCKQRFERDFEVYPFRLCPACRVRQQAEVGTEIVRMRGESAKGILELCSICKETYRTSSPKLGVKVCPKCSKRKPS